MKLSTVKLSFVVSVLAIVCSAVVSPTTRAENSVREQDASEIFLLVASHDVPAPPESLLREEWTAIFWREGSVCRVEKARVKAFVDDEGLSSVESEPSATLLVHGLEIPTGPFNCAKRIDATTKGSDVHPRLSETYGSFTYQFASNRISIFPEIRNDRVQVVYRINDKTQVIFRAASASAELMSVIQVQVLGDLDGDAEPDLWLHIALSGGEEQVHDILYLSGEADDGNLLREVARSSVLHELG